METLGHSSFLYAGTQTADEAAGPKACATCRLSHVSCDRKQPCGRCVRMGKAESCQPPPSRKRGRPRKSAPPDEQQPPPSRHQRQPPLRTTAPTPPAKRVRTRPETATDPRAAAPPTDRPLASILPRPPLHASAAAIDSPSNTSASSPSSSSWSSSAEEECASSPSHTTAGSLHGHQRFDDESTDRVSDSQRRNHPAPSRQAGQDPILRSLLMLVVDQVREIRQENERLHDTIAELRATQKETERRQARVEEGHQTKIRQLEQAHIELCQKMEHVMAHRLGHAHTNPAFSSLPQFSQPHAVHHSPLTQPHGCAGLPLVAMTPTSRAEAERFVAQTLPFLQEFDCSSLIIRDLRRPFLVMRIEEAETLDDMETPIIVYASPPMCSLLGYDKYELHGSPICSVGTPEPDTLATYVRMTLMRPPTPVGQPFHVMGHLATKQGRGIRAAAQHQVLYNQRRLAQWCIMLVLEILETDIESASLMKPVPNIVRDPIVRAHLVARLPHSLLFGRRGELATEQPAALRWDSHQQYDSDLHQQHRHHHHHHRPESHFEESFEQVSWAE